MAAMIGSAAAADPAPTVVELFTSQGCNSCPPAEALLGELAQQPGVVALEYHVTYWDRLGWPDPFATAWGTDRQYGYAAALAAATVYTPQMVIDGAIDVIGSRRSEVATLIADRQAAAGERLAVTMTLAADGVLHISVAAAPTPATATVWLLRYDDVHRTAVPRGENGGRELANYNVVRERWRLGEWTGTAADYEFATTAAAAGSGYAVLVQIGEAGRILGAANLLLPGS